MTDPRVVPTQSESRQVPGVDAARYELKHPPEVEPRVCRYCGTDIVAIGGRWYALAGRWPNLAHCHYSAGSGESVGHDPESIA